MSKYKSDFLNHINERGFIYQISDADKLDKIFSEKNVTAYIGFDCTAKSLHVGSLLQIMVLRLMQKNGHRPIVLLGGGTTLIGDPSGKDTTRKILTHKEIKNNIKEIKTAVLWKKKHSTFHPDFCAKKLDTNPWIVQPFEKYEEIRIEDIKKGTT